MRKYTPDIFTLSIFDGRICSKCKKYLHNSCFHRDAQKIDGYTYVCKQCKKEKVKASISEKKCKACKEVKSVSEFHKDSYSPDGFGRLCKICNTRKACDWIKTHPERAKENMRKAAKAYAIRNPDRHIIYHAKYRIHINHRISMWQKNNRAKCVVKVQRYRAKKRSAGGTFTLAEWMELRKQFDNRCAICREVKKLSVDHIIPISKGGKNDISNIQPLCMDCNRKKSNKILTS